MGQETPPVRQTDREKEREDAFDELDKEVGKKREEDSGKKAREIYETVKKSVTDHLKNDASEKNKKNPEYINRLMEKAKEITFSECEKNGIHLSQDQKKAIEALFGTLKQDLLKAPEKPEEKKAPEKTEEKKPPEKRPEEPKSGEQKLPEKKEETPKTIQGKIEELRKGYDLSDEFENMDYVKALIDLMRKTPKEDQSAVIREIGRAHLVSLAKNNALKPGTKGKLQLEGSAMETDAGEDSVKVKYLGMEFTYKREELKK